MKNRQGFVSNSSSSSFIIMCKDKVETPEDVKKIILKTDQEVLADIVDYYGTRRIFTTTDASETICPKEKLKKVELKRKLVRYIFDKFDFNYMTMEIKGVRKYMYDREAPVQHLLGHKIDLRVIAKEYNKLLTTIKVKENSESDWMKSSIISCWVVRKLVSEICKTIFEKYPHTFYREIGDNSYIGSYLEHDYKWKVKYIKINNH